MTGLNTRAGDSLNTPIQGAKKITWYFTRANHSSGSTAFTVDISHDGSTCGEDYDTRRAKETSTYLVSSGLLNPGTQLCDDCDFMKWGTWGGHLVRLDNERPGKVSAKIWGFLRRNVLNWGDLKALAGWRKL